MGSSHGKESRPDPSHRPHSRHPSSSAGAGSNGQASNYPGQGQPSAENGSGRDIYGQRTDLPIILHYGARGDRDNTSPETRRETKAEREARKLAKEREIRAKEREQSLREEGVDGGYLVTLGTYIGPEDFNKPTVRQLQIERRLAPFWRGLDDHSESWVEHQLIAAAKGLSIPAADEVPPESPTHSDASPRQSSTNINHLTIPITSRTASTQSDHSMNLSSSHPAFASPQSGPASPSISSPLPSPFLRGRAKTLAALATSSRNASQADMSPQEVNLPKDPYVNGQRLEVFLYKNAAECPICFLYYPPYLNKTRCCDQPICSECFVQIKRPDPHAPEHHDDPSNPTPPAPVPEIPEAANLVSEPSQCPFCKQIEFGVTYDAPPFRRGLVYANSNGTHPLTSAASAMSSTSSLHSQGLASPTTGNRRRTTSLSANAPQVITTDRVRPDWAKKLSDARAYALRRAAAATALHNAAYVLGGNSLPDTRGLGFGRRRRNPFAMDSASSSGRGTPRQGEASTLGSHLAPLLAAAERQRANDRADGQEEDYPGRGASRRARMEDIEELMMLEAIRLSLAAEEERKRKEEKEAAKEAKKEEKRKAKEDKKAQKAAKKSGLPFSGSSSAMASRSSLGVSLGKGKEVDRSQEPPLPTANTGVPTVASASKDESQRHLEKSRARLEDVAPQSPFSASVFGALDDSSHREVLRQVSNDASSVSSVAESTADSLKNGHDTTSYNPNASGLDVPVGEGSESSAAASPTPAAASGEPMLNFQRLTAVVREDEKEDGPVSRAHHVERIPAETNQPFSGTEGRAISEHEGSEPAKTDSSKSTDDAPASQEDTIAPTVEPAVDHEASPLDHKNYGDVSIVNSEARSHQITQ